MFSICRGAPGEYTFYVGLRLYLAWSLKNDLVGKQRGLSL